MKAVSVFFSLAVVGVVVSLTMSIVTTVRANSQAKPATAASSLNVPAY